MKPPIKRALLCSWVIATFTLISCSTTVSCPKINNETKLIALIIEGKHPSLVIQNSTSSMVCYTYGDKKYYALARTGIWPGLQAMLWPTQAVLGKENFSMPTDRESILQTLEKRANQVFIFEVQREKAQRLLSELNKMYSQNTETKHYNASYNINFVDYPESYSMFNTSNHKVAEWLSKLDCKTKGPLVYTQWTKDEFNH